MAQDAISWAAQAPRFSGPTFPGCWNRHSVGEIPVFLLGQKQNSSEFHGWPMSRSLLVKSSPFCSWKPMVSVAPPPVTRPGWRRTSPASWLGSPRKSRWILSNEVEFSQFSGSIPWLKTIENHVPPLKTIVMVHFQWWNMVFNGLDGPFFHDSQWDHPPFWDKATDQKNTLRWKGRVCQSQILYKRRIYAVK